MLLFLFTVEIVMAVENYSIRQEELRQAVTSAVYTALEMSVTEPEFVEGRVYGNGDEEYLNGRMKECFLNALQVLIKSDSHIRVSIQKADYKKGILDVDTEAEFTYHNGKTGYISYRKTGILNEKGVVR
ncbi:MAG: hypothetical protein K2M46_06455 [Lachnospiraceae bacterium]|nr:hypothetical protein [Lachnospiraceae bacterium]